MADWDETSPGNSDIISQYPPNERAARAAARTNFGVDHHEEDDVDVGKHEQVTLLEQSGDPASATGQGRLYTKDDGSGNTELYYIDDEGNVSRLSPDRRSVTNFINTTEDYTWDEAAQDSVPQFVVDVNVTQATWESVGPTGSGADHIWTALDDLPTDASILKIQGYANESDSGAAFALAPVLAARPVGSTVNDPARRQSVVATRIGEDQQDLTAVRSVGYKEVPLNANNVFEIYWDVQNDAGDDFHINLIGFKR